MLATLGNYQNQMWAITLEGEALLNRLEPQDPAEVNRLRMELARVMTAYQLFVHREVFEPLIRTGTPAEVNQARAMKSECILIAEEFRAFVHLWTAADIAVRWADYQAAGLDFARRIRAHIERVRAIAPACLAGRRPAGLMPPPERIVSPIGTRAA
jgi:ABC-type histidine transport system ATPase subunit